MTVSLDMVFQTAEELRVGYLAMRKAMQKAACLDLPELENSITITAARGRRDYVFVKRKRYEDDDDQEVDYRTYRSHRFWSWGVSHCRQE